MKKRVLSLLLILVLAFSVLPLTAEAAGTLSNFAKINTYQAGQFSDVSNEWFAPSVQAAYEYGLMGGTSPTTFAPAKNLTIGEALKIAACLHSIYNTGAASFPSADPWYQPYVDYALQKGIIAGPYANYITTASRSDFAVIFAAALPDEALSVKNTIDDNAVPDVKLSYSYGPAVYKLYRAGILTGSDSRGTFNPNSNIQRSEVAAIVARMVNADSRRTLTLSSKELTATEISVKCSPAVFYIEVYDSTGKKLGLASGFFISSSGRAVTNFHVIDGASSAKIRTVDGKTYDVAGVYDYSEQNDLAILQVSGSNFPYLELGDSSAIVAGQKVYAIGSPAGLDNTISDGMVSNPSRLMNGVNYIQISAAISHGSSGGALLNTNGQVIGVTAAVLDEAQNLNFAVPINLLLGLTKTTLMPMSTASKPAMTLTANPSSVTVDKGAKVTVTITASSDDFYYSYIVKGNESLISCEWGDESGNTIQLIITGVAPGSGTQRFGVTDTEGNVLAETSISFTVTASGGGGTGASVYYPGYYPVPDWGAFTGTPLFEKYPLEDGSVFFDYKMSDVTVAYEIGVDKYLDVLKSTGFSYMGTIDNSNGEPLLVFSNPSWYVYFGIVTYKGVSCMEVLIIPLSAVQ